MAATISRKFSGKKCLELLNWYEYLLVQDKFKLPLAVLINDEHC